MVDNMNEEVREDKTALLSGNVSSLGIEKSNDPDTDMTDPSLAGDGILSVTEEEESTNVSFNNLHITCDEPDMKPETAGENAMLEKEMPFRDGTKNETEEKTVEKEQKDEVVRRVLSPDLESFTKGSIQGTRIIHFESNRLEVVGMNSSFQETIKINKYPGHINLVIGQIERYFTSNNSNEKVIVRIEHGHRILETKPYDKNSFIKINELFKIAIPEYSEEPIKFRFILETVNLKGKFDNSKYRNKVCEAVLELNDRLLDECHNNLIKANVIWHPYISSNPFKNIKKFFMSSSPAAWSLKTYVTFISDDEIPLVNAPPPTSAKTLGRWLIVKKHTFNLWFKGFVNMRGQLADVCTHLWKRRYIKWYGYTIFVFNEHSRTLIGSINIVEACYNKNKLVRNIYLDNCISLKIGSSSVELHFDTKDKCNICRAALDIMFPRAIVE